MRGILTEWTNRPVRLSGNNQNRKLGYLFNPKQINLRFLAIRVLALCLTASLGVFVDQLISVRSKTTFDERILILHVPEPPHKSTLVIQSIPSIPIPESFRHMENQDFWVFTSAELDSDGLAKNIIVNFGNGLSFKDRSLYENLLFRVNEQQGRRITRELAETLIGQISQIKFEPALNNGVPRLSHVVVSTHFHSSENGTSIKWEVETSIETSFESRDTQVVGGLRVSRFQWTNRQLDRI